MSWIFMAFLLEYIPAPKTAYEGSYESKFPFQIMKREKGKWRGQILDD